MNGVGLDGLRANALQYWPACAGVAGLYCLYKVFTFLRADADLRLLSKRRPPKDAYADKVVWITGASQGLGEELAKQFAAQGAYLILSARNSQRLEAVKQECQGKHAPGEVKILPLDVTSPYNELQQAAKAADEAFGTATHARGIHLLIHNAGASQRAGVEDTAPEVLDALLDLNVAGTLKLTRAVLPLLLARSSTDHPRRITVVGSLAGHMPAAGQAAYAACKAAIAAYFRSLHSELWTQGVRVTLCQPGPIATGVDGQVRSLYGSSGLLTEAEGSSSNSRQSPRRVAELILKASHHGLDSVWIAKHPILLLAYLVQYWPRLGYWVLNKIGPARASSYRNGAGGYDISMLATAGKKTA